MKKHNLGDSSMYPWAINLEELKGFDGFTDLSEEESMLIIETLVKLATIAIEIN